MAFEETDEPGDRYNEGEFDFNNPPELDETGDKLDETRMADEFPPPPPDGKYKVVWDFGSTEEKKRFKVNKGKTGRNQGRSYLMAMIQGKIVAASDDALAAKEYENRVIRTNIMTLPNNDDSCSALDWLKSVMPAAKAEAIAKEINEIPGKSGQLVRWKTEIENAIIADATGWVMTRWEGSYDRGEEVPASERYRRPKSLRGMKNWPVETVKTSDGDEIQKRVSKIDFEDPDDGPNSLYEVRAQAEVRMFVPNRSTGGEQAVSADDDE